MVGVYITTNRARFARACAYWASPASDTGKPHNRVFLGTLDRHPGLALAVAGALGAGIASFLGSLELGR